MVTPSRNSSAARRPQRYQGERYIQVTDQVIHMPRLWVKKPHPKWTAMLRTGFSTGRVPRVCRLAAAAAVPEECATSSAGRVSATMTFDALCGGMKMSRRWRAAGAPKGVLRYRESLLPWSRAENEGLPPNLYTEGRFLSRA